MKAHIKDGELILLPDSTTEEWAVNQWLDEHAGGISIVVFPKGHEDREEL